MKRCERRVFWNPERLVFTTLLQIDSLWTVFFTSHQDWANSWGKANSRRRTKSRVVSSCSLPTENEAIDVGSRQLRELIQEKRLLHVTCSLCPSSPTGRAEGNWCNHNLYSSAGAIVPLSRILCFSIASVTSAVPFKWTAGNLWWDRLVKYSAWA